MITKDLFKELILTRQLKNLSSEDLETLSTYLSQEINRLNSVRSTIKNLRTEITKIKEEYTRQVELVDKKIENLQKDCFHSSNMFHADPSGNNDSYYECLICGKNY